MHRIKFVGDDELPAGHDFVVVQQGDALRIFYRQSAMSPALLEESWAALRALQMQQPVPPPPSVLLQFVS